MGSSEYLQTLLSEVELELQREAKQAVSCLSGAELSVLVEIVSGKSAKMLCQELGVTIDTALALMDTVRTKLGAATNADAVRIGIYAGLGESRHGQ